MMLTEEKIPKLISIFPFIGVLITVILATIIIVRNDFVQLDKDIIQIKNNYIEDKKQTLQKSIHQLLGFIKYAPSSQDEYLLKNSVIEYIENIMTKNNNYIFIIDDKSTVITHPELEKGIDSSHILDVNGISIAQLIIQKAKNTKEGGFVTYYWNRIGQENKEKKTTFVYYFQKWNWIIATGTYMNQVQEEINRRVEFHEQHRQEDIFMTIMIALIFSTIILILSFSFSRAISNIFNSYRQTVSKKESKLKALNAKLAKSAKDERYKRTLKEQEMEFMYKDSLTGLPNKLKLLNLIDKGKEENNKLIILNINRFTDINRYYSPLIGDTVLIKVALLLINYTSKYKDISIFKLAIDEYAIFSTSDNISEATFIKVCKECIKKIDETILMVQNYKIFVSVRGGIALNCSNIFLNADTALKFAKEKNKDYIIYNQEDNIETNSKNNIKWTKVIKQAIENDQIVVYKQAIVDSTTNKISKYECLARIKQEDGTIISPYEFLDISKKIKLYPYITQTIIKKAFKHFKDKECNFSINIMLDDILNVETVNVIFEELEKTKVGHRVIFEIVESEGIDNFEEVNLFINKVRAYDCKIAIDDFGTGYSNFVYLMRLNVDFIKIDGSFIKNIHTDNEAELIVNLILKFSQKQNIQTIAEFVHSNEVYDKVKDLGIDYSQGYYLHKPEECIG